MDSQFPCSSPCFLVASDDLGTDFSASGTGIINLDSCFLCKRKLGGGHDIFMYRGDTPFCSDDCRQEHIDAEDAVERRKEMVLCSSTRKARAASSSSPATAVRKENQVHVRAASTLVAS